VCLLVEPVPATPSSEIRDRADRLNPGVKAGPFELRLPADLTGVVYEIKNALPASKRITYRPLGMTLNAVLCSVSWARCLVASSREITLRDKWFIPPFDLTSYRTQKMAQRAADCSHLVKRSATRVRSYIVSILPGGADELVYIP
jgi:hypothetical protein